MAATAAAALTRVDPAPGGAARSELAVDLFAIVGRAALANDRLRLAARRTACFARSSTGRTSSGR